MLGCVYMADRECQLLSRQISDLLPGPARCEAQPVTTDMTPPFAEEQSVVERAVGKRRAEFSAGRRAAYVALTRLGTTPAPLLADQDRVPIWPETIVGSISHTHTMAIAAAAHRKDCAAIGVDIEDDAPLAHEIVPAICTRFEIGMLATWSAAIGFDAAKLIFSAKEAFYKCHFPRRRAFLEFHDAEFVFLDTYGHFVIEAAADWSMTSARAAQAGRFAQLAPYIVTTVVENA